MSSFWSKHRRKFYGQTVSWSDLVSNSSLITGIFGIKENSGNTVIQWN
jgi:hypothetical protein